MKKLIRGIIDFRKHRLDDYRRHFSQLALGQSPDTIFIACSDSRVVPNVFASTDPGDLFVIRNVGNFIPPYTAAEPVAHETSTWAAIEFALLQLHISDVIVCGHSECGAIQAIRQGRETIAGDHLRCWLTYGEQAATMRSHIDFAGDPLAEHNQISQANVLLQLTHLASYPLMQERLDAGQVQLHGWWFDIGSGNVYRFDTITKRFTLIAES